MNKIWDYAEQNKLKQKIYIHTKTTCFLIYKKKKEKGSYKKKTKQKTNNQNLGGKKTNILTAYRDNPSPKSAVISTEIPLGEDYIFHKKERKKE